MPQKNKKNNHFLIYFQSIRLYLPLNVDFPQEKANMMKEGEKEKTSLSHDNNNNNNQLALF